MKLILLLTLSLLFDVLNGLRDGGNFASTLVSSHVLSLRQAFYLAALAQIAGPFLFGVTVAETFGARLVLPETAGIDGILVALLSAILWNLFTWALSFPGSATHALLGGMLGVALAHGSRAALALKGATPVLLALVLSPLAGLLAAFLLTKLTFSLATVTTPRVNWLFRRLQILTEVILAASYGANDSQKTMGLVSMGLVFLGVLDEFRIPVWVMILCTGAVAAGILLGGQRLVRTLGGKFYRIRPIHGYTSQASAAVVILAASWLGQPVSSSQVITSSIMGAGAADRINQVRWSAFTPILRSWLGTFPACAALGYSLFRLLSSWLG